MRFSSQLTALHDLVPQLNHLILEVKITGLWGAMFTDYGAWLRMLGDPQLLDSLHEEIRDPQTQKQIPGGSIFKSAKICQRSQKLRLIFGKAIRSENVGQLKRWKENSSGPGPLLLLAVVLPELNEIKDIRVPGLKVHGKGTLTWPGYQQRENPMIRFIFVSNPFELETDFAATVNEYYTKHHQTIFFDGRFEPFLLGQGTFAPTLLHIASGLVEVPQHGNQPFATAIVAADVRARGLKLDPKRKLSALFFKVPELDTTTPQLTPLEWKKNRVITGLSMIIQSQLWSLHPSYTCVGDRQTNAPSRFGDQSTPHRLTKNWALSDRLGNTSLAPQIKMD